MSEAFAEVLQRVKALKPRPVLVFDSGNELVIHAMKARPQMLDLLP